MDPLAPLTRPPTLPWSSLEARLRADWEPGQHVTIIGPAGHGKTHLALTLAEMCRHVMVLATKRKDPLVAELAAKGYHVTGRLDDILWTADSEPSRRHPVNPRVVFWPQFPEKSASRERLQMQANQMREAIDWADKTGGWAVVVDETMWLADTLRLQRELDTMWFQGRTQGLSVIANAQRPSRVPRLAFSQASYLFIGKYSDKRDIDTLREISSAIPTELVENGIRGLSKPGHEFLFVDTTRDELAVVVAPPR